MASSTPCRSGASSIVRISSPTSFLSLPIYTVPGSFGAALGCRDRCHDERGAVGRARFAVFGRRRPDAPHSAYVASHIAIFSAGLPADRRHQHRLARAEHLAQPAVRAHRVDVQCQPLRERRRAAAPVPVDHQPAAQRGALRARVLGDRYRSVLQHQWRPCAGLATASCRSRCWRT